MATVDPPFGGVNSEIADFDQRVELPVRADCRHSNLRSACSIAAIGNQRATGDFTVTPSVNRAPSMADGGHSHGALVSQVR